MADQVNEASKALEEQSDELYLGDAIHFFLNSKLTGGRCNRTVDEYRKKLELFQKWAAARCRPGLAQTP